MRKRLIRYLIFGVAFLAVFYPVWVWYSGVRLTFDAAVILDIFPVLGLLALVLMWLHIVGGALRPWLEHYVDFGRFVTSSSVLVLMLLILHPLLLLIGLGPSQWGKFFSSTPALFILLAVVGWVVLVGYDVAKKFKHRDIFVRHWEGVKFISTMGFFLVLIHSLGLGRDLQSGLLRIVWIFYGISAAAATSYTYFLKRILTQETKRSQQKSR